MTADVVQFSDHARVRHSAKALKPNMDSSTDMPLLSAAERSRKKYCKGMRLRDRQLQTADVLTPAKEATVPAPPSWSMSSSAELVMPLISSRYVKKSRGHALEISRNVDSCQDDCMSDDIAAIARRLTITREALGLSAAELCRQINCKPNRWSQYEAGERKITIEIANRLCDLYAVTLDWIYRGNAAMLPAALHAKMRKAA